MPAIIRRVLIRFAGKAVALLASIGIVVPQAEFTEALTVTLTLLLAGVGDWIVARVFPKQE